MPLAILVAPGLRNAQPVSGRMGRDRVAGPASQRIGFAPPDREDAPPLPLTIDLSDIESPKLLGTIGEYFHDVARRGDLVFAVLTGLKVYRLGADPRRE